MNAASRTGENIKRDVPVSTELRAADFGMRRTQTGFAEPTLQRGLVALVLHYLAPVPFGPLFVLELAGLRLKE